MSNPSFIAAQEISKPANTDLSTKQWYVVDLNSSGNVAVAGAGSSFIGVLTNKPDAAGKAASVAISGQVPVIAGGTVAPADFLKIDSSGRVVAASSGDKCIGRCMAAATVGAETEMLIQPQTMA